NYLGCVAAAPAEATEHGRRGERGQGDEDRLPTDEQNVGQGRRNLSSLHAVCGAAEDHRRRRPSLTRQGYESDQQKGQDRPRQREAPNSWRWSSVGAAAGPGRDTA